MAPLSFEITHNTNDCHARVGWVTTPHGSFDTPAFMPVGTQATVKGQLPEMVDRTGAQIILGNTYHLLLRPGSELVAQMGGLQKWMRWNKPILTDSGGYQVFSLSDLNKVTEDGVRFKSHLDGAWVDLTPERSMQVQNQLGADIIMAFDECPPATADACATHASRPTGSAHNPQDAPVAPDKGTAGRALLSPEEYAQRLESACDRSNRWLDRCVAAHARKQDQALFGIIQGGVDLAQRDRCVEAVCSHDLPGYAIGGVAVGEGYEQLKRVVEHTAPRMPRDKPRYLMGVGYERDLLAAVRAGVDMFDCVLPTRNGRNANAFTPTGQIRLKNAKYARSTELIDAGCDCTACHGGFTRSYLRHLFQADEMLGPILVSLHNLRHFQRYLLDMRRAIMDNDWSSLYAKWPVATAGDS